MATGTVRSPTLGWHQQQLVGEIAQVIDSVRSAVHEGRFDTRDWDHNSPNYRSPRSNKRVKIAASLLLGREPKNMEEAWQVVIDMAVGPRPAH